MNLFNDGKHLARIIDNFECKRHRAPLGVACWNISRVGSDTMHPAICGKRIKAAGYNGKVSQTSMQLRRQKAS